jgi:hypothetical protein
MKGGRKVREPRMTVMSAECIPDPHGSRSWVVVVKHGDSVIEMIPFPTQEKGEQFIVEMLAAMRQKAEDEGYV